MCLLCASLAWLETYQARIQFEMSQKLSSSEEMQHLDQQLKAGVGVDQLPQGVNYFAIKMLFVHSELQLIE